MYFNLFKSIIIIITCLYAVVGAISSFIDGGNRAEYGYAMIYGVIATLACFTVSGYMKYQSKPLRSDLVAVEAHTWFVDGVQIMCTLVSEAQQE